MHWNHVVALISLLLMSPLTVDATEKTCRGTEVKELEDGCTIINEAPLIFRDLKDGERSQFMLQYIFYVSEALIKKKTETISIIEHRVEVIETNTESFDYLKNVTKISNKEGSAIAFRRNLKLKRFNFGGSMILEHISRSTNHRTEKCSKQFIEVRTTKESTDDGYNLAMILIGLFAIFFYCRRDSHCSIFPPEKKRKEG
ncbi:hypothetical protein CRE_02762 [Caenorhabditis remanei]|uniref:Receptor L-domain domain-containing protein n=1 Tax=Caenorhabditis remanei TaxID=31234 RepID=E3NSA6_CAERE|nr:hypothetical protein CRE_02762 [Caenorhabditis remanei]